MVAFWSGLFQYLLISIDSMSHIARKKGGASVGALSGEALIALESNELVPAGSDSGCICNACWSTLVEWCYMVCWTCRQS